MGVFKAIGNFLKKLLNIIKKVLAILLIVIAVILFIWATICTAGATLLVFGFAITQTMAVILGVLAVVGAFLIDGKTSAEVVGKIGQAASDAAETIGKATGDVAEGLISGLTSSPVFWIAGGLLLVYFLGRDGPSPVGTPIAESSVNDAERERVVVADMKRDQLTGPSGLQLLEA